MDILRNENVYLLVAINAIHPPDRYGSILYMQL